RSAKPVMYPKTVHGTTSRTSIWRHGMLTVKVVPRLESAETAEEFLQILRLLREERVKTFAASTCTTESEPANRTCPICAAELNKKQYFYCNNCKQIPVRLRCYIYARNNSRVHPYVKPSPVELQVKNARKNDLTYLKQYAQRHKVSIEEAARVNNIIPPRKALWRQIKEAK